jgi:hypothetical protein
MSRNHLAVDRCAPGFRVPPRFDPREESAIAAGLSVEGDWFVPYRTTETCVGAPPVASNERLVHGSR